MLDSFSREINYLRISVTDNCNLRCLYCMPEGFIPEIDESNFLSFPQIWQVAEAAVGIGISKFRLTGGEPTVRKDIVYLVKGLKKIPGMRHLAMTSNGVYLDKLASPLREAGLDSLNISLDTLNPLRYTFLTRGGDIKRVLAGIDAAAACAYPLKINMVVLDDTDPKEIAQMRAFAVSKGASLQTIKLYRLDRQKQDGHSFDRPQACSLCNRIRMLADGRILTCLHSDDFHTIDFNNIRGSLMDAIGSKPEHGLKSSISNVNYIGG